MSDPKVVGPNAGYETALLYDYLENPEAVPEEWRAILAERLAGALARDGAQATPPEPPLADRRRTQSSRSRARGGARARARAWAGA